MSLMPPPSATLHVVPRNVRRAKGIIQSSRVQVTGDGPNAVLRALTTCLQGRHDHDERLWIRRIEAFRTFLLQSPEPFTMVDYGAGTRAEPTLGTVATTTRTIGEMTLFSKPRMWARLLLRLVREFRPSTVLELGSCVGISGSYLVAALELNGGNGTLVSLEGVPALAERSTFTLNELGLANRSVVRAGEFASTLPAALSELTPLACAFIDGNHEQEATLSYVEQIIEVAAPETLLVFDDINYDDGMRQAWAAVVQDPRYSLTVDLRSVGLAVLSRSASNSSRLSIGYY